MGRPACAAREAALAAGEVRYPTGRPCANGHMAERQTSNSTCLECKNELEIKRRLQVRRVTPYKRNPQARAAAMAAGEPRYQSGIPCVHGHMAERLTSSGLCVVCFDAWWADNRERQRLKSIEYRINNPEEVRAAKHRYRALLAASPERHTGADLRAIFEAQNGRCAYYQHCGTKLYRGYHIDHIQPLAKGGHNGKSNIQLLCALCNQRKSDKDPLAWAAEIGLLA